MEQSGLKSEYYVNLIITPVRYWFRYKGKNVLFCYIHICM